MQTQSTIENPTATALSAPTAADTRGEEASSVVDLESPGHVRNPGCRMDAALTRDRNWRREREEALRRRLAMALCLENLGRAGCVLSGLLVLPCGILRYDPFVQPHASWEVAGQLFKVLSLLLPASSLVGLAGALLQRIFLGQARRNAVELPAVSAPHLQSTPVPSGAHNAGAVQEKLEVSLADERLGSGICVLAGWCSLVLWGVITALRVFPLTTGRIEGSLLVLTGVIAALPLIAVPFAAIGSLYSWCRRKHLLQQAVRCGAAVHDPARVSPYLKHDRPQAEAVGVYHPPTNSEVRGWNRLT